MRIERWRYTIPLRLRAIFRRSRVERELDEEFRFHLEQQIAQLIARGTSAEEARRIALARFGGVERRKDEVRDTRAMSFVEHLGQDIRYAIRTLLRSPVFASVTVVSLALGMGATTSVFGVVDALVLRRLPVPEPERLVVLLREQLPPARTNDELPYEEYTRLRDETGVFSGLAAMNVFDRSNIALSGADGGTDAGRARVALVTGDYFDVLGAEAQMGRTLSMDDDRTLGSHPVAVISDAYRKRRLGGSRDVIGRRLALNGTVFDIVGVMPSGFAGHWIERPADIWVPFSMHQQVIVELPFALTHRNDSWLHLVGRLAPGVTLERAQVSVQSVYQRVMQDWAGPGATSDARRELATQRLAVSSAEHGYSPRREALAKPLVVLSMVVGLVLDIACANVAALLLARAAAREREMAVRLAIGAGRGRLTRQLLTESTVLALLGGFLGVVLAVWGTLGLAGGMTAGPVEMFWGRSSWITFDAHVNTRALLATGAICLTTGLLFGLAPAIRGSAVRLSSSLSGRGSATSAAGRFRLGKALVVVQVALTVVVVIAAGLFVRTLRNLDSRELGFERDHVLLLWTQPSATGANPAGLRAVWRTVIERLSSVPGVVSVSASNGAMLNGFMPTTGRMSNPMTVEGQEPKPSNRMGWRTFIAPRYFETMGIPLIAGREFTEADVETAPRVVIISQSLARHDFGDANPVGRRVAFSPDSVPNTEIVGVARDVIEGTPREMSGPPFRTYFSYQDRESVRRIAIMMVVVRTIADPRALALRLRQEIHSAAPSLPVLGMDTVDDRLADVLAQDRLIASLATFFAMLASLLACLGLYGVIAYTTARRTSEIGVRVALGASRPSILRMVLAESAGLTLGGITIGVPAAIVATRFAADRFFGVTATDVPTIVAAAIGLLVVTGAAGFVPARRAARVDPVVALRAST
jgi:macrolide transport system ATP-binding/permease protein